MVARCETRYAFLSDRRFNLTKGMFAMKYSIQSVAGALRRTAVLGALLACGWAQAQ